MTESTGRNLVLLAASGLAREVESAVRARGVDRVVAVLDDDPALRGSRVGRSTVVGSIDDTARFEGCLFVVCAGSGASRASIVRRVTTDGAGSERFATVIHPSVDIPDGCSVGSGSVILAQTVFTADVAVGAHVVLMPHVVLTHDSDVDDYATLCAGVVVGGGVRVGRYAYLGMNSSVRENVRVGAHAVLGMGAVALTDVPPGETRVGCPAVTIESARFGQSGSGAA